METHPTTGIKTPPYTYHNRFKSPISPLLFSVEVNDSPGIGCSITFTTATNTLGSLLLLTSTLSTSATSGELFQHILNTATSARLRGLADELLYTLALSDVYTMKTLPSQHKQLEHIYIIGVGGVENTDGYRRMLSVGATAVGIGTALGSKVVKVFEEIERVIQQWR